MPQSKGLWVTPTTFVNFAQSAGSLSSEIATRERSIDFTGLAGYLPNPDPVLKKAGKDITVYRELLADAHVAACVESRRAGVLSLLWEIDRGKSKSRQAKFITDLFNEIDVHAIISDALDGALFGFQPLEVIWTSDGGRTVPEKVEGKPPEWFQFGEAGELRFRTLAAWLGEPLPERKFILARHRASYANPYGAPALAPVFWPLTFKKGGIRFWVMFTEKYGMPWLIGKHQPGASTTEKSALLDMLEKMIQDGIAVVPNNAEISFEESSNRGASVAIYQAMLTFCNAEISKALLGQTLTTEIGDKGSYAASQTHGAVRDEIVEADRRMVEAAMNTLIDWICWLNFGDTERPRFCMYAEEDVDAALATRDQTLAQTGQIRFSKSYFQRAYGFADDEIEVREPPAPGPAFPPGQGPSFAEAQPPVTVVDQVVDRLEDEAPADDLIEPIRKLVLQCESFDELRDKLLDAYKDMDASGIAEMMTLAMTQAELLGRSQVEDQIGARP